ncbi:MAG TPA: sugar ABC transporter ATP-binding protein [Bryobacteraceae bacterium]|nr:sugar ABC transporter ATP-binding protein [Bryobacteraceae bacterium]
MDQSAPLLEVRRISKSFGGNLVLDAVTFDVRRGEVHGLVGENGAGKSTLMNVVSGVLPPDGGEMLWEGRPVRFAKPRDAQALGIGFVHQELALVPQLSVAENIFLGRHPVTHGLVNLGEMHQRARRVLAQLGRGTDPRRPVAELSLAERQLVEIARAVAFESRLIIMDEPTAPLDDHEAEALFRTIRLLRARGVGVIYISHRLKEIFEISDRVTVLRDGRRVLTQPTFQLTHEELVRAMIGTALNERLASAPSGSAQPEEALRIRGSIDLTVRRGEIVGLAGLAGAGRTSLLEWLFGAAHRPAEICVEGRRARLRSPVDAIRHGLALVPDDRKNKGLVLGASVMHNMALAGGRGQFFIRRSQQEQAARQWIGTLRIKVAGLDQPAIYLSGGTQQKLVLAKWLFAGARVFLLDEPTRGIDVGAKAEIYDTIRALAGRGAAVLMASSELEELMGLADRIVVMHRGRIAGELSRAEATEEEIMHLATGGGH